MQTILIGIVLLLLAMVGILLFRLWCYRAQIKHITEELSMLEEEDTNYRLSSYCAVGKTEELIKKANDIIEKYRETGIKLKKENVAYRESITSISHDIRTPLTSAKGYIQMMQGEKVSQEKRAEYAEVVERRLDDVMDMLNQLFEYARIEAGEMAWESEVLNAGNLFAETLSMFYDDFTKRGCEPEVEITQMPCRILGDRHAFVRIVENLIKNALVHGKGGYRMALQFEEGYVVLQVSNRTDSIEEKEIERIFDRFYTTDQSRSRKTTGLGLAIVKKFAEQMGGTAEAALAGECFTVKVRIPLI
ncbi:MAG: HAMP domain-containing histidine kinase [Lachnospiraceae bacterium]|nr:HAMP domain-containing histidine kinase [Lachnospiraceae bacterium]